MALIENYIVYNERMNAGIKDKLWFVDMLLPEIDTIVDFGCADCSLGLAINHYYPNKFRYIGIDNDAHMRDLGSKRGFIVVEDIDAIESLNIDASKTVIVFSSVMHELLTYTSTTYTRGIFHKATLLGFKQIAIRDMHSFSLDSEDWKDWNSKHGYYWHIKEKIEKSPWAIRYKDFEEECRKKYRPDEIVWPIEFLLKYDYTENWDREKAERYLYKWESLVYPILYCNYHIDYDTIFRIPYQVRKIREEFDIELNRDTHKKMLFTKREEE